MSVIDTLITTHQNGESYGAEDLNRIGQALSYVASRLTAAGYPVAVVAKQDFAISDIPVGELVTLLNDVAAIRAILTVLPSTPTVPPDMDKLTAAEANDIEKILQEVDRMVSNMIAAYRHSGTFCAGQGGLIT